MVYLPLLRCAVQTCMHMCIRVHDDCSRHGLFFQFFEAAHQYTWQVLCSSEVLCRLALCQQKFLDAWHVWNTRRYFDAT